MADKLKEITGKILEWWKKFTNKQRTIIVAIVAVVIFTFVIVLYVFTRPQFTHLTTFDNSSDAAEVLDILDEAGITHRETSDLRTVEVLTEQLSQANYAMASAGYRPDNIKLSDYINGSMSTTSWEQQRQYESYIGDSMAAMFKALEFVRDAKVKVTLVEKTGTLWAQQQQEESSAYIQLDLLSDCSSATAAAIARSATTILGNSSTAKITIMDYKGNLLFAGGDDYSFGGQANSMQELREQLEAVLDNQTRRVLYGTNQYSSIDVKTHLEIDYAAYEDQIREYYANDGMSQGMLGHEILFESSSTNGVGGTPGTDSNGDDLTDYDNPDYNTSENTQTESERDYLPNIKDSKVTIPPGTVDYGSSSMAITMISYREYYEESVRAQGLLDGGMTWEQFKEDNRADVRLEVDDEVYEIAYAASGINRENIRIIAYESPVFYDKESINISGTDVLSVVMIVLILLLLGFVILRSMGSRKRTEEEEELPVEDMLQSTQGAMEDIDVEAKSETRKLIEKFVDENPEAAANLLRNWLNEDWN